jgi:hypothetical protein
MQICVPYTRLTDATRVFLSCYDDVKYVELDDDPWSYTRYMQDRWDEGQTFINVEHDVVGWPGALERLMACEKPWCVHGYTIKIEGATAPFGFAKITDWLMTMLPNVWDDMLTCGHWPNDAWAHCDSWFFIYAKARGIHPHQHLPSVLNVNPRYLRQPRER